MTSNAAQHEPYVDDTKLDDPELPAPRTGDEPTGRPAERGIAAVPEPSAEGPWSGPAREARTRLVPERAAIPAPRTAGGVEAPPVFGAGPGAAPADLVRAVDGLVTDLTAIEDAPGEPAHRALLRIAALMPAGVPEQGWSAGESLDPAALAAAATLAGTLHAGAAALLERLDAADRPSSAVVVDALVMRLRVAKMVAELEVFARDRG